MTFWLVQCFVTAFRSSSLSQHRVSNLIMITAEEGNLTLTFLFNPRNSSLKPLT